MLGERQRFFYAAKPAAVSATPAASATPRAPCRRSRSARGRKSSEQGRPVANIHPTVKPIELMRWLVRLLTPPGGLVLDPFAGSGSTGAAAMLEGARFLGIERERDYIPIARARIKHWAHQGRGRAAGLEIPRGSR